MPISDPAPDAAVVLEVLQTAGAGRYLRSAAVQTEHLETLVWAATRAASPNNSQHWHFVVVTDPSQRRALRAAMSNFERWMNNLPEPGADEAPTQRGARHLFDRLAEAPALIVVCGDNSYPPDEPRSSYLWSAIGGACQNLLVCARALGLGATVTMFHVMDEPAVARVLELPAGVRIGAIMPIGWPDRPFRPVRRKALEEVLHHDRWRTAR